MHASFRSIGLLQAESGAVFGSADTSDEPSGVTRPRGGAAGHLESAKTDANVSCQYGWLP